MELENSHNYIKALIKQLDSTNSPTVNLPRQAVKSAMQDLLLLIQAHSAQDHKKIRVVRGLAVQFACMSINSLLMDMMRHDLSDMTAEEGMMMAIKAVSEVYKTAEAHTITEGLA